MKKTILILILLTISIGLFAGCSNTSEKTDVTANDKPDITANDKPDITASEIDVREIAYNQLSTSNQERIQGTWQDAKLSDITLRKEMGNINDDSYIGKEVYLVDFSAEVYTTNNIIVYIGKDNYNLIGYGYVD